MSYRVCRYLTPSPFVPSYYRISTCRSALSVVPPRSVMRDVSSAFCPPLCVPFGPSTCALRAVISALPATPCAAPLVIYNCVHYVLTPSSCHLVIQSCFCHVYMSACHFPCVAHALCCCPKIFLRPADRSWRILTVSWSGFVGKGQVSRREIVKLYSCFIT